MLTTANPDDLAGPAPPAAGDEVRLEAVAALVPDATGDPGDETPDTQGAGGAHDGRTAPEAGRRPRGRPRGRRAPRPLPHPPPRTPPRRRPRPPRRPPRRPRARRPARGACRRGGTTRERPRWATRRSRSRNRRPRPGRRA